ncbi:MAG: nicotinamide riboside transporter PnuC [Chloroflexota bacterium]
MIATTDEARALESGRPSERRSRSPHLVLNRDVVDSLWIASVLTGGSYLLAGALGWITAVNALEAFAVFTSYACTWLCVKQRRFNYAIGAMSTAAYCVLFWNQGLVASAALNAYLTPSLIYGWWRWRADAETRPVTHVEVRRLPVYLGVTALAYVGAVAIAGALGGTFAAADSVILVGSILAQFLLDNKKVETWFVWFAVNLVAIWLYLSSGLAIAGLQYVLFLATAVLGFWHWRLALRAPDSRGEKTP